jgi:hypothetical protein
MRGVNLRAESNMKVVGTLITVLGLSLASVNATLDPGTAVVPMPPTPGFLFLPSESPIAQPHTQGSLAFNAKPTPALVQTSLPFAVVAGDLVLLESSSGGLGRDNWSDVLRFENTGTGTQHGVVTLYTLTDWSSFVLDADHTGNIKYVVESSDDSLTSYRPGGTVAYGVQRSAVLSIVPESSTMLAGALLLLPLGVSTIRILRRNRVP